MSDIENVKPPHGLSLHKLWIEARILEVNEAIARCGDAKLEIPKHLLNEGIWLFNHYISLGSLNFNE